MATQGSKSGFVGVPRCCQCGIAGAERRWVEGKGLIGAPAVLVFIAQKRPGVTPETRAGDGEHWCRQCRGRWLNNRPERKGELARKKRERLEKLGQLPLPEFTTKEETNGSRGGAREGGAVERRGRRRGNAPLAAGSE